MDAVRRAEKLLDAISDQHTEAALAWAVTELLTVPDSPARTSLLAFASQIPAYVNRLVLQMNARAV